MNSIDNWSIYRPNRMLSCIFFRFQVWKIWEGAILLPLLAQNELCIDTALSWKTKSCLNWRGWFIWWVIWINGASKMTDDGSPSLRDVSGCQSGWDVTWTLGVHDSGPRRGSTHPMGSSSPFNTGNRAHISSVWAFLTSYTWRKSEDTSPDIPSHYLLWYIVKPVLWKKSTWISLNQFTLVWN